MGHIRRTEHLAQDDGDGFIEQDVPNAFEPFYTTKSSGTGLGLSICRQELELMWGDAATDAILGEQRLQYSFPVQVRSLS